MLTTLDQLLPAPVASPVPVFPDSYAFAGWLNDLTDDITGQSLWGGARWLWEGELDQAEYQTAIWCEVAQDADAVAGLVGYFCAGPLAMGGEWSAFDPPAWTAGHIFIFDTDLTKSQRDDVADVLTDPDTGLAAVLRDGSRRYTTNRVGPIGSQKWPGLRGRVLIAYR